MKKLKQYKGSNFIASFIFSFLFGLGSHAQNFLWAQRLGSALEDWGYCITTDASGNILLTGTFEGTVDFDPGIGTQNLTSAGSYDIFFAKYDANGNYMWAKRLGGTSQDEGVKITTDASGNILLIGNFKGTTDFDPNAGIQLLTSAGLYDIFFAKYDANGNYIWANNIGNTSNDFGGSITTDATGNIFLTGNFAGTADFDPSPATQNLTAVGMLDSFFAKYDANGNYIWANRLGSPLDDRSYCITTDNSGNVILTGAFQSTLDFDPGVGVQSLTPVGSSDIFFAKYNNNGNYLWAHRIGSTAVDEGISITIDASSNILLTGYFQGTADFDPSIGTQNLVPAGNDDIFLAKYDANGNYIWAHRIGSTSWDEGGGIATDAMGNVFLTGYFSNTADFDPSVGTQNLTSAGAFDIFFAKYDANGNYIWAHRIGNTLWDRAFSIATNASGNVLLCGVFQSTVDFDPGPGTQNLITAGGDDIFFTSYATATGIEQIANFPIELSIFPNPTSNYLNIKFNLQGFGLSYFEIFNEMGQCILKQNTELLEPGQYSLKINNLNLPDGLYYLRLNEGGCFTSKRFIIER